MNSPLATIAKQLRRLPWNKRYWGDAGLPQQSELDHIAMGTIFSLTAICLKSWWLYLGFFLYHVVLIEIVLDTWWRKKNSRVISTDYKYKIYWYVAAAQVIERGIGFVLLLPFLIWKLL